MCKLPRFQVIVSQNDNFIAGKVKSKRRVEASQNSPSTKFTKNKMNENTKSNESTDSAKKLPPPVLNLRTNSEFCLHNHQRLKSDREIKSVKSVQIPSNSLKTRKTNLENLTENSGRPLTNLPLSTYRSEQDNFLTTRSNIKNFLSNRTGSTADTNFRIPLTPIAHNGETQRSGSTIKSVKVAKILTGEIQAIGKFFVANV